MTLKIFHLFIKSFTFFTQEDRNVVGGNIGNVSCNVLETVYIFLTTTVLTYKHYANIETMQAFVEKLQVALHCQKHTY